MNKLSPNLCTHTGAMKLHWVHSLGVRLCVAAAWPPVKGISETWNHINQWENIKDNSSDLGCIKSTSCMNFNRSAQVLSSSGLFLLHQSLCLEGSSIHSYQNYIHHTVKSASLNPFCSCSYFNSLLLFLVLFYVKRKFFWAWLLSIVQEKGILKK